MASEAERREIQRVAGCWEALHLWPQDLPGMTRIDVRHCAGCPDRKGEK